MIILNFYKNGFVFEGHDEDYICGVVSYAGYSCVNDCFEYDNNLVYYESALDNDNLNAGSSYMILSIDSEDVMREYWFFRENLTKWCKELYNNRVAINDFDEFLELEE